MPPSGTPIKLLILDDLLTTLAGINGGTAYYTTVAVATRVDTMPIDMGMYPAIILVPEGTNYDPPGQVTTLAIKGHMRVEATLIVRTRSDAVVDLENFIRDVHKAILIDPTRGDLAIDTKLNSDEVFYPTDNEEPVAVAKLSIEIIYRTDRDNLNQAT